jgi:hypothetical protein
MKRIIIADKRMHNETEKAYVFFTSGYGGKMFAIPKSQVISKQESGIQYNEVHIEPATEYLISEFIYNVIKDRLQVMSEFHFTMPKQEI